MHVTWLHIFDYIRCFMVMLQVWVSGDVPSSAGQVGLWFLFSEKVTFASSELVYMTGATWPLLKPSWGSASSNFYCSVHWFLLPRSDLVLRDVGGLYPLNLCQHGGLTALYCSGQRGSDGKEMWEGVESKGEASTDFFFSRWLCYVRTTGLGIWISPPLSTGSEFRVFMM